MNRSFRQLLRAQKPLIGTFLSLASPEAAEIIALSGVDWIFMDMEHGAFGILEVQRLLQAAGNCPAVVRVPSHDEVWIKKVMDTGPDGVLIPHVNTPEQTRRIIRCCKYPPLGQRDVGIARAQGYGATFQNYIENANDQMAVIIQIEHIDGVRNIDEIVRIPGVDAVFIGPYDLSGSMNKPGQVRDAEVETAVETVRQSAADAGLPVGIFGVNADAVRSRIAEGYTLIACGIDAMLLGEAVSSMVKSLKST
ncbi:MAG TPA: 2,4-dihydroxyhept-2-ene-1,7-dioic acid aldolase [bacterium]|nr:2,4-dihydroxyhept-2-ene-1,7-dioic acid aldolase [bacterium]